MEKFNELTTNILSGNLNESKQAFKQILAEKVTRRLDEKKKSHYDKDLDADRDGKLTKKDCCSEEVELDEVSSDLYNLFSKKTLIRSVWG